jgi:hypothetical protein
MNSRLIGLIIAAVIIIGGGYYGYTRYFAGPTPAPAGGLPAAAQEQLKKGIETALATMPNVTAEQKTQVTTCATTAITAAVKPEDAAKLATDTAAQQAMMTQLATAMKDCLTKAGVAAQ